mmetsp:Transcript_40334/g.79250  ORF Transcript_40334/g.79250 Transcript_40334/m.79250 type:complete len:139 (+) Transcript_40334:267-683(+)
MQTTSTMHVSEQLERHSFRVFLFAPRPTCKNASKLIVSASFLSCRRSLSHNFEQCNQQRHFRFKSFILKSTAAAAKAKTRNTRDPESSRQRGNAQESGEFFCCCGKSSQKLKQFLVGEGGSIKFPAQGRDCVFPGRPH